MGKHSVKKFALTPIQNRIFWAIEEAGAESILQVLIEVTRGRVLPGTPPAPSDQAPFDLVQAIRGMSRIGFLEIRGCELESPDVALEQAAGEFRWDAVNQAWSLTARASRSSRLELILTEAAYAAYRVKSD